jgi:hypothetical protein
MVIAPLVVGPCAAGLALLAWDLSVAALQRLIVGDPDVRERQIAEALAAFLYDDAPQEDPHE